MHETGLPIITVNSLADFGQQTDKKKINVIRDLKFKQGNSKPRQNNSLKSALIAYLTNPNRSTDIFDLHKEKILQRERSSKWQISDINNSLEMLKKLKPAIDELFAKYYRYRLVRNSKTAFKIGSRKIGGVIVSMKPDIILEDPKGGKIAGMIKFIFSKNEKITPMKGQVISGFIRDYVEKKFKIDTNTNLFLTFDVYHKNIIPAPRSFYLHKIELNKTFKEVVKYWDSVSDE